MSVIHKIVQRIGTSAPANFLVRKSKATYLPGFSGIPLFDVAQFFSRQVQTIGMKERASAIAFNFVMAIPPAIIFLFTLIPYFPISNRILEQLYGLIRDVVPGEKDNSVLISFLNNFIKKPRNGLLSLGFILSLYFSSNAIMGIMRSFDKNYVGFRKRNILQKRGTALQITVVLYVLVFASVMLLVGQGAVLKMIGIQKASVRAFIVNARWVVIVMLFFTCISYIYRHAPAVHKKWKLINPGSILASFLMVLFTLAFSYWVSRFGHYNQLYGSIGTVLILMLLIFFNSLVLLIGFELNVSISSLKRIADERKDLNTGGSEKSG